MIIYYIFFFTIVVITTSNKNNQSYKNYHESEQHNIIKKKLYKILNITTSNATSNKNNQSYKNYHESEQLNIIKTNIADIKNLLNDELSKKSCLHCSIIKNKITEMEAALNSKNLMSYFKRKLQTCECGEGRVCDGQYQLDTAYTVDETLHPIDPHNIGRNILNINTTLTTPSGSTLPTGDVLKDKCQIAYNSVPPTNFLKCGGNTITIDTSDSNGCGTTCFNVKHEGEVYTNAPTSSPTNSPSGQTNSPSGQTNAPSEQANNNIYPLYIQWEVAYSNFDYDATKPLPSVLMSVHDNSTCNTLSILDALPIYQNQNYHSGPQTKIIRSPFPTFNNQHVRLCFTHMCVEYNKHEGEVYTNAPTSSPTNSPSEQANDNIGCQQGENIDIMYSLFHNVVKKNNNIIFPIQSYSPGMDPTVWDWVYTGNGNYAYEKFDWYNIDGYGNSNNWYLWCKHSANHNGGLPCGRDFDEWNCKNPLKWSSIDIYVWYDGAESQGCDTSGPIYIGGMPEPPLGHTMQYRYAYKDNEELTSVWSTYCLQPLCTTDNGNCAEEYLENLSLNMNFNAHNGWTSDMSLKVHFHSNDAVCDSNMNAGNELNVPYDTILNGGTVALDSSVAGINIERIKNSQICFTWRCNNDHPSECNSGVEFTLSTGTGCRTEEANWILGMVGADCDTTCKNAIAGYQCTEQAW